MIVLQEGRHGPSFISGLALMWLGNVVPCRCGASIWVLLYKNVDGNPLREVSIAIGSFGRVVLGRENLSRQVRVCKHMWFIVIMVCKYGHERCVRTDMVLSHLGLSISLS